MEAFGRVRASTDDLVFPRGTLDPSITIIGIDTASIGSVAEGWPWSRSTWARIVSELREQGARVIVLDALFADEAVDDPTLASVLGSDTIVAAAPIATQDRGPGQIPAIDGIVLPVRSLAAAAEVGSSAAVADATDGVVRTAPMLLEGADQRLLPTLGAAAYIASMDRTSAVVQPGSGLVIGPTGVPTDDRYRMRISWPEGLDELVVNARSGDQGATPCSGIRGQFVSARSVLAGCDLEVSDQVVFVGATDPTLGDRVVSPVSGRAGTPGVAYHAAVFHTLASRQFIQPAGAPEVFMWVVGFVLAAGLITTFASIPIACLADSALMVLVPFAVITRSDRGRAVDMIEPLLGIALMVVITGASRYGHERRGRRRVTSLFGQYVPETVAADLVIGGRLAEVERGQRIEVSVLFCDLRGFTPLAAITSPSSVSEMLAAYYEYVCDIVLSHEGTVMQFVGDEVFVVFGAPLEQPDHQRRAINAATELQTRSSELRLSLEEMGLPTLAFGIGVHSGEVTAVHTGSRQRRQYVVIGDTVNVGSRLCGVAGENEVIVSELTEQGAGAHLSGEWITPPLKGIDRSVRCVRLSVPSPDAPTTGSTR